MAQRNILVLERNEKIRITIRAAIKKSNYVYHELKGSDNLFTYLNKHPVDVLLINSRQHGIGARSVSSLVRNDPQYRRFPLIILYGKPSGLSRFDYMKQGVDDFVEMPFTPIQLMGVVKARLRPLSDLNAKALSTIDQTLNPGKTGFAVTPLEEKGSLEFVPPTAIFAKLFVFNESGILDLIVRKETRTIYFKNGEIIYAETMSRKDDIADYLAKNRAGTGSGKELIAARAQAGGPKSDPNTYAAILNESKLIQPVDFSWWLRLYQVDMMANLFVKPQGVYQWQSLDIPEYAAQTTLEPFPTPRLIFQGIRRMKDRWIYRELLPEFNSVPSLAPDFYERAKDYGLTAREIAILKIVNGKRNLKAIGGICHLVAPNIENYLYACQQLQLIAFDITEDIQIEESVDINAPLEIPEEIDDNSHISTNADRTPVVSQEQSLSNSVPITEKPTHDESSKPDLKPNIFKFSLTSSSLEKTTVLETFRQCIIHKFSGQLAFQNLEIKKDVFWKRGNIITATSNDIDERLDNFLFRKKMITSDQRDQLRSCPSELIGSPNEIIKRKFLSIDKVFTVVKEQIEAIVTELLTWQKGDYQCTPDATVPKNIVPLDLSAPAILMSAFHQSAISAKWLDQCAAKTDYYRKFNRGDNLRGVKLTTMERRIINVLHEPLSVKEIIQQVDDSEDEILLSLLAMELSGSIERCSIK
ncbi:DUF4388 domain-containing protein [bacterium]|nr:DUF4388 domain-containing protein [bacterium]